MGKRPSSLQRLSSRTANGILGAVNPQGLFLDDLCAGGSDFKFLLVTSDACASNLSLMRTLTAYCPRYERPLLAPSTCWIHTMNGATRHCANIGSGAPLRTSHAIQSVRILDAVKHLVAPNSDAWNLLGDSGNRFRENEPVLNVQDLWTQLVALMYGREGPFGGFGISGKWMAM